MAETVSKRVPNPTGKGGFKKGSPGGPGRGKKKAVQEAGQAIVEEMERGYSTAEKPDDPPGVKAARKLAHEDYPKFLAMYLKAKEVAGLAEPRPVEDEAAAAAEVGEKEEKIEVLAKRLLDEWEAEDGVQRTGGQLPEEGQVPGRGLPGDAGGGHDQEPVG